MVLETRVIGHIGKDARLTQTAGKTVLNFSVAHTEKFTNSQNVPVENTIWVDCSLWDKDKLAQYLKAGTLVECVGKAVAQPYITKDGEAAASLKLSVQRITLLSAAKKQDEAQPQAQAQTPQKPTGVKKTEPKRVQQAEPEPVGEAVDDLQF